jgi:hypothetical protein
VKVPPKEGLVVCVNPSFGGIYGIKVPPLEGFREVIN